MTLKNTKKYINILQNIVASYNLSSHAGLLRKTPLDVHFMDNKEKLYEFRINLYKKRRQCYNDLSSKLTLGEKVRLVSAKTTQSLYKKGYLERNTREIFQISRVNKEDIPTTYTISDLAGNLVKGIFYKQELIACNINTFDIEIIKTRKIKGKKQYLVKYINYPYENCQWVSEKDIVSK